MAAAWSKRTEGETFESNSIHVKLFWKSLISILLNTKLDCPIEAIVRKLGDKQYQHIICVWREETSLFIFMYDKRQCLLIDASSLLLVYIPNVVTTLLAQYACITTKNDKKISPKIDTVVTVVARQQEINDARRYEKTSTHQVHIILYLLSNVSESFNFISCHTLLFKSNVQMSSSIRQLEPRLSVVVLPPYITSVGLSKAFSTDGLGK